MNYKFILFATSLVLSSPVPLPDVKEILLAHTNPAEFAKVHSPAGLTDRALFKSAHNARAPNPPNSLAAGGGKKKRSIESDALYASLWNPKDPTKLNAQGQAALSSALQMMTKMSSVEPANAELLADLTTLQSFAKQQKIL